MFAAASTRLLGAAALAAAFVACPARAQTSQACTTITAVPVTLSNQGVYCLAKDFTTNIASGAALQLAGNNITIDCRGHSLTGTAALAGTRAGGVSGTNLSNIIVRNCGIRGFSSGIFLSGANGSGHVVENNRLAGNGRRGVFVQGAGAIVRGNRVVDTGGTNASSISTAIDTISDDAVIENNIVAGVYSAAQGGGLPQGIVSSGLRNSVTRNQVLELPSNSLGSGKALTVYGGASTQSVVTGNTVIHRGTPVRSDSALATGNDLTISCRENVFVGFTWQTTLAQMCHDAGHNVAK